ncbi:MAG TPA: glycyl radical protein, partial [Synergistales bacterium]|nr:glycyl radical protein [Synergistales bacterium]
MNERIERLRTESFEAPVTLDHERAGIVTDFYIENFGKNSVPVTRALAFKALCEKKSIYIGKDELVVGERGPFPKSVSTYPELNCHSLEDLEILDTREKNPYLVPQKCREVYRDKVIPYWRGRTMRDKIFADIGEEWKETYAAGYFTEFMEQRAPGHTTLDGKFYSKGMEDFKKEIAEAIACLDFKIDPEATKKREQLKAMDITCDAVIIFAERHAELAKKMAAGEGDPERRKELEKIASNCMNVPRRAPRDFWEALQMYWFMHLGTITELNGWDAMNPGHLDRYFDPFYQEEIKAGTITPEWAKELLSAFWIKFNNHPAPPKVGVTAAESGTYNDFTNINLGGLLPDGTDGVNDISYMMLEVMDEIHLLQPQANIQLSRKNPDRFLKAALRVIRKGYGYPSVFNADTVIEQMIRAGKTVEDAREGGTSGCVETGAFGKEAYILTGYLNTPKIFELALNNGVDPVSGKKIGVETGDPAGFKSFEDLYAAFEKQLHHIVDIKVRGNQFIERMYADYAPAVFLSVLTDDCIKNGKDYNDGGPRYNTNYIQCVGIGTMTDSLSALKKHVFEEKTFEMSEVVASVGKNFDGSEAMRLTFANKTSRWGNDDDYADDLMKRVFNSLFDEIDGRRNTKGGEYHIDMLPTTCHVYFGSITGATPDGRLAGTPLSEGISPVQGADRNGPTAVIKSCGKMDQIRTGGTLLNMKFMPKVLEGEEGIDKLAKLVRTYFRYDAHHIQFNVV